MNRFTRKVLSGVAAGLAFAAVANAQQARSGAWTLNAPEGDWFITGRDYSLQRYSPLKQITTANVKDLKAAWTFSTGTLRGHEGNPLVVGNVMYVHTSFPNIVYALDLSKEGAPQIWKYVPNQSPDAIPIACCDVVNRGARLSPERQALHPARCRVSCWRSTRRPARSSGRRSTRTSTPARKHRYKQGATMTNAPIVIKDIVIAGISGGEFGVRGRVTAYNVNDGKQLWRGYSTGPDREVKIDGDANANYAVAQGQGPRRLDLAGRRVEARRRHDLGLVLLRPGAQPPLLQHRQPGHLEPRPAARRQQVVDDDLRPQPGHGKAEWAYQMTPHDEWDYDGVNENILFDSGGKKLLAPLRSQRHRLHARPHQRQGDRRQRLRPDQLGQERGTGTPVEGVVATGVPVKDPKYGTTSKKNTEGICPAAIGFKDQQPAAYSPHDRPLLRPDQPHLHGLRGRRGQVLGRPALRRRDRADVPGPGRQSRPLHRLGSDDRARVMWEIKENLAAYGGALTTAGGLVFYGTMEGWLKARRPEDRQGALAVQDPVGHHRQPDDLPGPRQEAVRGRVLGHRWLGRHRRGRRYRRRRSHRRVWARSARSATRVSSPTRAAS